MHRGRRAARAACSRPALQGTGSYVSPEDGVLILRLDNSFSWWNSKAVKLRTAVAEALHQ